MNHLLEFQRQFEPVTSPQDRKMNGELFNGVEGDMEHVKLLRTTGGTDAVRDPKDLLSRVTGRFYTHDFIAHHLVDAVLRAWIPQKETLRVIEPFCGDGRLITCLLEKSVLTHTRRTWDITIWDCDQDALNTAKDKIIRAAKEHGLTARVTAASGDSFTRAPEHWGQFDLCITNPPWEVLKPDRRDSPASPRRRSRSISVF